MTTTKKRPSSSKLRELLFEGNFNKSTDDLSSSDPVTITYLVLSLNEIRPYDRNPRREKNEEYENIKDSIRSLKILITPLCITRRPGEDFYMIAFGGNTRLAILNELYSETGDEAFNRVHCLFIPWQSESSVLSAHLVENTMRARMTLIDKAYAIQELKNDVEDELGKKISNYEFAKQSKKLGYVISERHLGRFIYAIKLDQLIPDALRSGMGRPKIDLINKMEKAYSDYCKDKIDASHFDSLFTAAMSKSDNHEYWDIEEVRTDLDNQLSELTELKRNLIRIEVDAILFNRPGNIKYDRPQQQPEKTEGSLPDLSIETEKADKSISGGNLEPETGDSSTPPVIHEQMQVAEKLTGNNDMLIHILWDKGYNLALKIARSLGLNTDTIMPVKCGMGFYLEVPNENLVNIHDKNDGSQYVEQSTESKAWWLLLSISEQYSEGSPPMWQHTHHYHILSTEGEHGLTPLLGVDPHFSLFCFDFLQNTTVINDSIFTDIFTIMQNNRKIKEKYSKEEIWTEDER